MCHALIRTCLAACVLAIVVPWSGLSAACQLELDHLYSITPFEDDGLSRAEREDCALGELHYYDEKEGWLSMRDEQGEPLRARDMAGLVASRGEFLIVVLEDKRVAMRWGGPGNGRFFARDAEHRSFYGHDMDGAWLAALRLGDLSIDEDKGQLFVGMTTDNPEYCAVDPDERARLVWDWTCVDPADAADPSKLQQASASGTQGAVTAGWRCRNNDLEIACDETACEVSDSHTAMDVTLGRDEISICAYSGCWSGRPAAITLSGPFLTYSGVGLPFSTSPEDEANISVTVETSSQVANILVAGQFANPATCHPR